LYLFPNPAHLANPTENAPPRRIFSVTSTRIEFFPDDLAATSVGPLVAGADPGQVRFTVGIPGATLPESGNMKSFNYLTRKTDPAGNVSYEAIMGAMVASATTTIAGESTPTRNYSVVAMEFLSTDAAPTDRAGTTAPNGASNANPGESSLPLQSATHVAAVRFGDIDFVAQQANLSGYTSTLDTGATADGGTAGKDRNRMVCVGTDLHNNGSGGTLAVWDDATPGNVVFKLGQYGDDDDHFAPMSLILCDPEGNFICEIFNRARFPGGLTGDANGRHELNQPWESSLPDPSMPYAWIQYVAAAHIAGP
jgi:hypothetical protein